MPYNILHQLSNPRLEVWISRGDVASPHAQWVKHTPCYPRWWLSHLFLKTADDRSTFGCSVDPRPTATTQWATVPLCSQGVDLGIRRTRHCLPVLLLTSQWPFQTFQYYGRRKYDIDFTWQSTWMKSIFNKDMQTKKPLILLACNNIINNLKELLDGEGCKFLLFRVLFSPHLYRTSAGKQMALSYNQLTKFPLWWRACSKLSPSKSQGAWWEHSVIILIVICHSELEVLHGSGDPRGVFRREALNAFLTPFFESKPQLHGESTVKVFDCQALERRSAGTLVFAWLVLFTLECPLTRLRCRPLLQHTQKNGALGGFHLPHARILPLRCMRSRSWTTAINKHQCD